MAEAQLQCQGNFVTLFSTNFPHIFENIFFSLDYDSYKNCMKVNSEWADVLTSERYKTKAKVVFRDEIFLNAQFGSFSFSLDSRTVHIPSGRL